MHRHAASVGFVTLAAFTTGQGQSVPTIDPTYGFPVPKINTHPTKAPNRARWIWAKEVRDKQVVYLRHGLRLSQDPTKARLLVTADNRFTAWVNGKQVAATPDSKDDMIWTKIQEADITPYLKAGENVIAIRAENQGGPAGAIVRLEVDGKPTLLSDSSWRVSETAPENWTTAPNLSGNWDKATEEAVAGEGPWGGQLEGPMPFHSVPDYLKHLDIAPVQWAYVTGGDLQWKPVPTPFLVPVGPSAGKKIILDFGKELTGRIVMRNAPKDVEIGLGESSDEAIEKPYVTGHAPATPYSAFRYATYAFNTDTDQTTTLDTRLDHLYYPVKYRGAFDCSDPMLTKAWYTGAYTAHLCMQQDIWDAPKRDRLRWMGDLHVSGEVINNVFADRFLMEQTLERLRADAQGGKPNDAQPGHHVNQIPGYSCAWVAGLADFHRHIGDQRFLMSQHQNLITLLDYMKGDLDENGAFVNKHGEWPFVDWSPDYNTDTPNTRRATHFFYILAAREAAFLFHEMGDEANAKKYGDWTQELIKVAQAQYQSPIHTFGPWRQENAMAVCAGLANAEERAAIYDQVLAPGLDTWKRVATPYYNNYVLFALSHLGKTQQAVDYIRSYWGGMLEEGATTWWEGYDPSFEKTKFHSHLEADNGTGYFVSLCHGWSAGPTNLLTERVLGIRPTGGGFSTCEIAPELGDLAWVTGTVPTPHGDLTARAEKLSGGVQLKLTIPRGVSASVRLPGSAISVGGSPVTAQSAGGYTTCTLGAGTWVVTSH